MVWVLAPGGESPMSRLTFTRTETGLPTSNLTDQKAGRGAYAGE